MRTIAEYVAARRAKWRSDTESTIRFESTLYRNALLKDEKREISRRERLPVELIRIDQLDEMELVELLISRIKAEIAGLSRVAERLKAAGVKLRRTKQIKVDLAVLREERGWLASEREAIRTRGYEKNAKFAELRAKFEAGEMAGELSPVEPRKEKPRKPTLAELTAVFASKDEVAAYIERRKGGAWQPDRRVSIGYEKAIYREGIYKWERRWVCPKGVPLMLVTYETLNEHQRWKLRMCRAAKLIDRERAEYPSRVRDGKRQCVINIRALQMEIAWLRHKRDEADPNTPSFASAWNERQKAKRLEKRKRIAERHAKYASDAERKAGQSAANRRYRERKALAAGKPMPRHYRKYATDAERYQAILASNRESARRRREREAHGEVMPRRGVVDGFSLPHKPRRGPMIVEVKCASWWGRDAS